MKKTFYNLCVFLALLCAGSATAQNNPSSAKHDIEIIPDNTSILRQNISRTITHLQVQGITTVNLIYDTVNYIDVIYNPDESSPLDDLPIIVKGQTLIINDHSGEAVYNVHLKADDLQNVKRERKATVNYIVSYNPAEFEGSNAPDQQSYYNSTSNLAIRQSMEEAGKELEEARRQMQEAHKQMRQAHKQMRQASQQVQIETDTFYVSEENDMEATDIEEIPIEIETFHNSSTHTTHYPGGRHIEANYYPWEERLQPAFLWAFTNWGDQWHNGLSKLGGDYNLRTTFSSFQFELQYAIIMTRHLNFSLGAGFEVDKYNFTTPIINCSASGILYDPLRIDYADYNDFISKNEFFSGTHLNDWSSSLTTKYVSLPVTIGIRFDDFHIDITALPALAINTDGAVLSNNIHTHDIKASSDQDISNFIEPYKLDLRLDLRYQWFGVFVQVATMPLFDTPSSHDVFPFKIGFLLKN